MYCENCGAKVDDDSKFCENCGALIEPEAGQEDARQSEPENLWDVQQLVRDETLSDLDELMHMGAEDEDAEPAARETLEKTMVFVKPGEKKREEEEAPVLQDEDRERGETPEETTSYGLPEEEVEALSALMPEVSGQSRLADLPELEEIFAAEQEPKEVEADFGETEEQPEAEEASLPKEESYEAEFYEEEDRQKQELEPEPEQAAIPVFPEPETPLHTEEEPEQISAFTGTEQEEMQEDFEEEAVCNAKESADDTIEDAGPAEEEPADGMPLFCMACGKRLPEGAAFCDTCGTATGEVEPSETYIRRAAGQGMAISLIKEFFLKPASTLEKSASEDAFVAGTVFFLVKDVILAVLSALFMSKLSVTLGVFGSWLVNGDPFGFAAKIFLCAVLLDALWLGVLYGAGYLFKGNTNIKGLLGACGTASLFTGVLLIAAVIITALFPPAALCSAAVTGAVTLVTMTKAAAAALKIQADKLIYLMAAAGSVYTIILFIAGQLLAR